MLNSLASYLLGYPAAAETEAAETTSSAAATPVLSVQVPQDVELFTKETDDDWLLIEKNEDESSESGTSPRTSSATSTNVAIPSGAPVRLTLAVSTYHRGESDEPSGAFNSMDESWFVTPPPCFTSGSVPVETSPLENLLIEHPSMSVYHRSPVTVPTPILSSSVGAISNKARNAFRKLTRNSKQAPEPIRPAPAATIVAPAPETVAPTTPERPASPTRTEAATPNAGAVQASPRSRPAYSPYQQLQQSLQIRTAQKLVQKATCQLNKRDSMERTNKAREILSSRNKRQRRSDRMNNHSGANNNRKC